jgi:hypothetical protein
MIMPRDRVESLSGESVEGVPSGASIGGKHSETSVGSDVPVDWNERVVLARAPDTSVDVLDVLAADSVAAVRRAVAMNTSTPLRLIDQLSEDSDPEVQGMAVRRKMMGR